MSRKNIRKSPTISATSQKIGTVMKGNDGMLWIVKSYNGIQRWTPYHTTLIEDKIVEFDKKRQNIISFDLQDLVKRLKHNKKIKKIGILNVSSNEIGIGELIYNTLSAKKGKYLIYNYNNSLIAVHEASSINQRYYLSKIMAHCDIGMFAFIDHGRIKKYKEVKKRKFGYSIPEFSTDLLYSRTQNKIGKKEAYYIYENNLVVAKKTKNLDPIAIFSPNGFGDGSFPIYYAKDAFMIMNYSVYDAIINKINKEESYRR
jgi:hypothetical protein